MANVVDFHGRLLLYQLINHTTSGVNAKQQLGRARWVTTDIHATLGSLLSVLMFLRIWTSWLADGTVPETLMAFGNYLLDKTQSGIPIGSIHSSMLAAWHPPAINHKIQTNPWCKQATWWNPCDPTSPRNMCLARQGGGVSVRWVDFQVTSRLA